VASPSIGVTPQNTYAPRAMAATVDGLATSAALDALGRGGSAIDAAIAANAVLTVTLPNQCGLGGDIIAVVHQPGHDPRLLEGIGRAGSGCDAAALRDAGLATVPDEGIAGVTVPGCVDGWEALHQEYGRLSMPELLAPAIRYAQDGFPASPFLARTLTGKDWVREQILGIPSDGVVSAGQELRRPRAARILEDVAEGGRAAFYGGAFGEALIEVGGGIVTEADLALDHARWVEPLVGEVFGARVWTAPPPTSGYLTLAAGWLAEHLDLPSDPDDALWAHLMIESMRQAAHDRPDVLHDGASGTDLISTARLEPRRVKIQRDRAATLDDRYRDAGTTFVTVVDEERTAISLIQSNCGSFGSRVEAPGTGIWLQNRGTGFTLDAGHPNEMRPGRRPAHTLSPALLTDAHGSLVACVGTRGGDSQPQVVLQLLARLLRAGQSPAEALAAPRWILRGISDETAFKTWESGGEVRVSIEKNADPSWFSYLEQAGHRVVVEDALSHAFGHAQIIAVENGALVGAADPRSGSATAAGY
jgi:gamma-glutamyltranspeptidase/glutathione hydrolase